MPRANRHYLPGMVWHITHRCHNRDFLLKFAKDKKRWVYWLFEAKKRFNFCVLNYILTSNHIHLLVLDQSSTSISQSMQLIAGRTAQEYNQRKKRKGPYWEDRYHATAVECGHHLMQCMIYIDLNMVRTGVVHHPKEWEFSGYHESLSSKQRYSILNIPKTLELLNFQGLDEFQENRRVLIEKALTQKTHQKETKWSESVAIGSKSFVKFTVEKLGEKALGRNIVQDGDGFCVREEEAPYHNSKIISDSPMYKNLYPWNRD